MNLIFVPVFGFAALLLAATPVPARAADLAPAQAALARKDFPAATRLLEQVTAAEPHHAGAWLLLGDSLGEQTNEVGLVRKAALARRSVAAYERAAALDPRSVPAQLALVQYYLQAPGIVGGSRAKALAHAQLLERLDAWQGNFWRIRIALDGRDPPGAFAACERMAAAEPASYRTLYQLGRAVAVTGDHLDRGAAALRQALTLTPAEKDPGHAHAQFRLGEILEKQADPAGARAAYTAALALDPAHAGAKTRLAKL